MAFHQLDNNKTALYIKIQQDKQKDSLLSITQKYT